MKVLEKPDGLQIECKTKKRGCQKNNPSWKPEIPICLKLKEGYNIWIYTYIYTYVYIYIYIMSSGIYSVRIALQLFAEMTLKMHQTRKQRSNVSLRSRDAVRVGRLLLLRIVSRAHRCDPLPAWEVTANAPQPRRPGSRKNDRSCCFLDSSCKRCTWVDVEAYYLNGHYNLYVYYK